MNNLTPNNAPTFESVWALLQENAIQQKENERVLKEKIAENKRAHKEQIAENERVLKEQIAENKRALKEQIAENERFIKEQTAENKRFIKEQTAESERKREKNWTDYEIRMKRIETRVGAWSNNHGSFAEEYFYNSFDNDQRNFFGEKFDSIERGLKSKSKKLQDEYDIVLYNHHAVAIIEVKYKAHENDIAQTMKKAETFRILCPDYKDFKIYLGLASLSFYPAIELKCTEQGIAVIKQVGDTVIINDAHVNVF